MKKRNVHWRLFSLALVLLMPTWLKAEPVELDRSEPAVAAEEALCLEVEAPLPQESEATSELTYAFTIGEAAPSQCCIDQLWACRGRCGGSVIYICDFYCQDTSPTTCDATCICCPY